MISLSSGLHSSQDASDIAVLTGALGSGGTEMQLALDLIDVAGARSLLSELADAPPEIVEVGTPVVIQEGMGAVTAIKAAAGPAAVSHGHLDLLA